MEGQLRHLLNGSVITDEPGGWAEFTEELDRNLEERIIHLKYSNTLLFIGDGYFTLRQLFEDSYCTEVTYQCQQFVQGTWQTVADGVIILSDIVWNLSKCTADATITDATVGARILNNKKVTTFPEATLSKSGVEITAVPVIDLEVFDPQAAEATYIATTRRAYDWKLCMQHMIRFVTDGAVQFASGWYDALPDNERFALVNGVHLRTAGVDNRPPEYSLQDLWQFAWRADNLMAGIVQEGGNVVFRVEQEDYWYGNPGGIVLLHQEDLEQSIDGDLLYAAVKMGSEKAIKNEDINGFSLPYVGLRTFSEENYALVGQCNTDNVLDLTLPFVVCTNAIEDCIINDDDGYDEDVFVIQYDRTTSKAYKSDYLTSSGVPWLYNERFLNLNVVRRWKLPASGVSYYADEDADFRAERTVAVQGYSDTLQGPASTGSWIGEVQVDARFQFDNDYTLPNFDQDNNWGNGTTPGTPVSNANSRYTAPVRGLYAFEIGQIVNVTGYSAPTDVPFTFLRQLSILTYIIVKHYNSANTLLASYTYGVAPPGANWVTGNWPRLFAVGSYLNIATHELYMQQGDYMEVWFKGETWIQVGSLSSRGLTQSPQQAYPITSQNYPIHSCSYNFGQGSYVKTLYVATFGGEVITATPDEFYSTKLEFQRHIDNAAWNQIKGNFAAAVQVAHDAQTLRQGYPRLLARKVHNGETEWELIANRNQVNR